MNLQNEIKEFVVSFFGIIQASFVHDDGVYNVSIPEKYRDHFHASDISITFEKDVLSRHNCELILPGSAILGTIIRICSHTGSISLKKTDTDNGSIVFRYHFFVDFSGISRVSRLMSVDIDSNTGRRVKFSSILEDAQFSLDDINSKNITSCYISATESIRDDCRDLERLFIDDANREFTKDFELFITKFESQIRDLDNRIHERERNKVDLESSDFRFKILENIKVIEDEKNRLIETLQEKHRLDLEYRLVACEIILS